MGRRHSGEDIKRGLSVVGADSTTNEPSWVLGSPLRNWRGSAGPRNLCVFNPQHRTGVRSRIGGWGFHRYRLLLPWATSLHDGAPDTGAPPHAGCCAKEFSAIALHTTLRIVVSESPVIYQGAFRADTNTSRTPERRWAHSRPRIGVRSCIRPVSFGRAGGGLTYRANLPGPPRLPRLRNRRRFSRTPERLRYPPRESGSGHIPGGLVRPTR